MFAARTINTAHLRFIIRFTDVLQDLAYVQEAANPVWTSFNPRGFPVVRMLHRWNFLGTRSSMTAKSVGLSTPLGIATSYAASSVYVTMLCLRLFR